MTYNSIKDCDLAHKRVVLRADLNVPVDDQKTVTDFTRIDRLKPTIDYLLKHHVKQIIILSHFGRPKGAPDPAFSLDFLLPPLAKHWGHEVIIATDYNVLAEDKIILLENTRFHTGEEKNDPAFAKQLAGLGDIFVNDAFSAAHRAHASTEGIGHYLPSYAGLLMMEELDALQKALETPKRPVMAIVGGSKISTKLDLLNNLVQKVDMLFLAGGMANTFLLAQGHEVGGSLVEKDMCDTALSILETAEGAGCRLLLPLDAVTDQRNKVDATKVPATEKIFDVGPETVRLISELLNEVKTVVWNGPLGVFEQTPFDVGTTALTKAVAHATKHNNIISVAGGGDTVSALEHAGVKNDFTYISTAGGAFLEWLEGKTLPGVKILEKGECRDNKTCCA
ncbi:MAG: phosphoglycerate kinase [Alphaproteobacteria bacterium]|nr:phosphoglycerate kinase [Alphaproteobacteria bacterium]